jgi:valyl-tRNA synthetase
VIDFVLSHTLRLFQPFLPFISEELWHGMGYAQDMPENQGGKTVMFAPWPKPLGEDFRAHYGLNETYLKTADAKYALVSQGRNLRREGNIPANKKVKYVFKTSAVLPPEDSEVMKLLLNAETLEVVNDSFSAPKGTPAVRSELGDLYLPLEGLIDIDAERSRLKKELEKAEAEIGKVEQKLSNSQFVNKVPPTVLAEHQKRLVEWQAKRDHVKVSLEALQ